MKKSNLLIVLIYLSVLLLCSCNVNQIDIVRPLFSVSAPEYRSGAEDTNCALGGIYFDFYNKANCDIVFIEIRFNVFDKKTLNIAFPGYGTLTCETFIKLKSGEKKQMCIPLDDYITVLSQEGYVIDQFYISRIEYSDGRFWKDDFGLYATSSRK